MQSAELWREKNVGTNGAEGWQNLDYQRTACAPTTNEGLAWQKIHVPMMGLILQSFGSHLLFFTKILWKERLAKLILAAKH